MSAIFITATGTDVGKTFVASGLIRHWRSSAQDVDALKPVATGYDPAHAEASDAGHLLLALGRALGPPELDRISPWRFAAALSPDMAARNEGKSLNFDNLVEYCRQAIASQRGTLLIEGIGGVMVPLDDRHTVVDWIAALNIPAVLVTGSYLGSLSHTLTCVDVLRRRKLVIKALVVNETPGSAVPMAETIQTLTNFVAPIPVAQLSRISTMHDREFAAIAALL